MAMTSGFGLQSLLKEGHKHLTGLEEAVLKNIEACKQLSHITRTSLGPNGMNKMIINHLDKLFVTSDAATIVAELEVQHPAAKLVVLAAKAQQEEVGDGANTVVSLAGELLAGAEELIRSGLHPSEIIAGYAKATDKVLEELETLVAEGSDKVDVRSKVEVEKRLVSAVASKQFGSEPVLCPLIADVDVRSKAEVEKRLVAAVASKQFGSEPVLCPLIADVDVRGKVEVEKRLVSAVASKQFGSEPVLCPLIADVDVRSKAEVEKRLVAAVASKQFGSEPVLCPLIADVDVRSKVEVEKRLVSAVASKQFGSEPVLCPLIADVDVRCKVEVEKRLVSAVASKQFGSEPVLCPLIADACMQVCPGNPNNFNVDNVRVAKILGGGLHDSKVVRGMVLKTDSTGTIKHATKAKIAVFGTGIDTQATETKGTVLIENAEQLENYAKSEEARVEQAIREVAESGATVVVSGQTVGEMALHFCERYKLMVLKISSKFELRRFCRTTGAVSLVKLQKPTADELGFADSVSVQEIGGSTVVVVENESGGNLVATVVLRGSTDSILDDVERAVDDGINTYKALCRDSRVLPGGGATEIELARRLKQFARTQVGLDQYAIDKYSEALEVIPRTLAENAGMDVTEILSALYAAHSGGPDGTGGNFRVGVDVTGAGVRDLTTDNIWDLFATKYWAIRFAADAVTTVLRVDQIIMAKVAGGPRRGDRPMDESED
ncbi:unnamed protein product [Closterium sp. Yama58-4]|nr:unnamed protein product [Closterium sp. Yama58-4]